MRNGPNKRREKKVESCPEIALTIFEHVVPELRMRISNLKVTSCVAAQLFFKTTVRYTHVSWCDSGAITELSSCLRKMLMEDNFQRCGDNG